MGSSFPNKSAERDAHYVCHVQESLDFLQTQLRETKHRAHSLEVTAHCYSAWPRPVCHGCHPALLIDFCSPLQERCKKNAAELDRMRKAFHARNERVQELEAELASNTMQGFGDMAAELGGVREELEELRKASQGLGIENRQLKADLEEVGYPSGSM